MRICFINWGFIVYPTIYILGLIFCMSVVKVSKGGGASLIFTFIIYNVFWLCLFILLDIFLTFDLLPNISLAGGCYG